MTPIYQSVCPQGPPCVTDRSEGLVLAADRTRWDRKGEAPSAPGSALTTADSPHGRQLDASAGQRTPAALAGVQDLLSDLIGRRRR